MALQVRAVEGTETKSRAEIEEELIEKATAKDEGAEERPQVVTVVENKEGEHAVGPEEERADVQPPQLSEEQVLSFIKERYGREITSLDELSDQRTEAPELPEDVTAYWKYKQETGRSLEDFYKLQKDYADADENTILAEYMVATDEAFDLDEAIERISLQYDFDEEVDEDKEVKMKKLNKKNAIAKARKYFTQQKEKYKLPLESRSAEDTSEVAKELERYRKQNATAAEEQRKKADWFTKKTDEIFNPDFKGFEFDMGDRKLMYAPGKADEVKKLQSDVMNFLNKFIDENGYLVDPKGYHKALSVAFNPDKFAKVFYDQGVADAIERTSKSDKNIDMSTRRAPEVTRKDGLKVRSMSASTGSGLKIKNIK